MKPTDILFTDGNRFIDLGPPSQEAPSTLQHRTGTQLVLISVTDRLVLENTPKRQAQPGNQTNDQLVVSRQL